MHKNLNNAIGNFAIYEIRVDNITYKIGKADIDRITLISGAPTKIHQQLRKLRQKYGVNNVIYQIIERLFGVTTKHAKEFEKKLLESYFVNFKVIPEGNAKSFETGKI